MDEGWRQFQQVGWQDGILSTSKVFVLNYDVINKKCPKITESAQAPHPDRSVRRLATLYLLHYVLSVIFLDIFIDNIIVQQKNFAHW